MELIFILMKNKCIFSQSTTKKISDKNDIVYIFANVFNVWLTRIWLKCIKKTHLHKELYLEKGDVF